MTIRTTLAALFAVALAITGCGSSTSSSGNTADTGPTTDTVSDTGIGTGNDTATGTDAATTDTATKDTVKADIGTPAPTWGSCAITDQACIQGCVQGSCADSGQACASNTECAAYQTCQQNCNATPIVLPTQATPVAALPGEDTPTYCFRVCGLQATGPALALDQAYVTCIIGDCIDCSTSASQGITKAQCQSACGEEFYCTDAFTACLTDTDCLAAFGCLMKCSDTDTTCQNACITNAKNNGPTLFKTFNDCANTNATKCIAP